MKKLLISLTFLIGIIMLCGISVSAESYTVKQGDTLTKIAKQQLGDSRKYTNIFEANKDKISDPNKIYIGMVLLIPEKPVSVSRGITEIAETVISTMDLREPCGLTAEQIDMGIGQLVGLGKYFKAAEGIYHVNAVLLAAIAMHESGGGTSRIAKNKKNLFGHGSCTDDPYAASTTFKSEAEGIYTVARLLNGEYLSPNGKYFEGYSVRDINVHYAEDKDWYKDVEAWMKRIMEVGE